MNTSDGMKGVDEVGCVMYNAHYFVLFSILNVIYSCDQNWIFSIITPVFSVTWSFRNQYNMMICWYATKKL